MNNLFLLKMNLFYFSGTVKVNEIGSIFFSSDAEYWQTVFLRSDSYGEKWLRVNKHYSTIKSLFTYRDSTYKLSVLYFAQLHTGKQNQSTMKMVSGKRKNPTHIFSKTPYRYCFALSLYIKWVAYLFQNFSHMI